MDKPLVGSEIHGFHTMQDLDVDTIMEEAKGRWLRPNEIHALLYNYKYFTIHVKPVNLPPSGTIVLFDRKMLRNFRKDGHNWKKKKDGKTVKEAHEHLKVGNEERIHVYYAHGEDSPTFVRRCYWLLDKSLEHIVLVHYRETQEVQGPATPVNSNSNSSSVSDPSAPWRLSEELDSGAKNSYYGGENELLESGSGSTVNNHEQRLHDINTLEWDELLVTYDSRGDKVSGFDQQNQLVGNGTISGGTSGLAAEVSSFGNLLNSSARTGSIHFDLPDSNYVQTLEGEVNSNAQRRDSVVKGPSNSPNILGNDGLRSQDSFGRWINQIMTDPSGSVDDPVLDSSFIAAQSSFTSPAMEHIQSSVPEQIFIITDVSPSWAFSNEKTKILITGFFHQEFLDLAKSNLLCICGDVCIPAEIVQVGVYRCFIPPHVAGLVNLFISLDGHKPISQVLNFEYRSPVTSNSVVPSEENKWEEFQLQMRLANLLFSSSKSLSIVSSKVSPYTLKEAKKFSHRTSHISNSWQYLIKSIEDNNTPLPVAKDSLFELILKNRLKDWLLEKVLDSSKTKEYDSHGQGVIHLCAILDYTWAVRLFSWSGLSLDFRDRRGWTALHWAAYHGREKMVAVLLSAGAKPNLVTDPTSENPGGCTVADIASMNGYDGLAAYLSEKALVEQFKDMSLAGNVSGSLQTNTNYYGNSENLSEEDLYLKDTLTAYQTAADAAARIQAAIRENTLKLKTKAVQYSTPEDEARSIIAALKIQHAFRHYDTRKKMAAAARIQYRFRTWKMRQEFLNMRRQAVKIQAAFRAFQTRRQYQKILWGVGVLEKAVLRWRLKRKGLRGLQVDPIESNGDEKQESDTEEDFYRNSRKQAEERVERSVVRVQAMFRSKKAQQEYRRMKLTHNEAELEYDDFFDPDNSMRG
ncbi:PREDICTED: calmodulin-binding transcription activator 5 [Fragaria vesca subsp. vesca]|uniref:calmodulin-binding transcription activator 5 n=1 Tax=Fragaria vesca subsp. vesca TaxID=101020 RepID=UPI0002C2EF4C|nr:PREDICTED: calmodulin-binding transcription activator 5 [Fragaria vesca subsp. vesca]